MDYCIFILSNIDIQRIWAHFEKLSGILGGVSGIFHNWDVRGLLQKNPQTAVKSKPVTLLLQFFGW